ncbi:hypothetical protein H4R19_005461 [Coemansia spiralis]|nr:hypothetical protein H4R19_005461 [Coemansia spiralis]
MDLKERAQSKLEAAFPGAVIELDEVPGGCGDSFTLMLACAEFEGLPYLKRHRLVHGALKDEMKEIHALQMSLKTVAQYRQEQEDAVPDA